MSAKHGDEPSDNPDFIDPPLPARKAVTASAPPVVAPPTPEPVPVMTINDVAALLKELRDSRPESANQLELLQAAMTGMQKAIKPENEFPPMISDFSYPEGDRDHPKPLLTRETFFGGRRERESQLRPEQIELYNAITKPGRHHDNQWTVDIQHHGDQQRLFVQVPCRDIDMRMGLPSLTAILSEIVYGPAADGAEVLRWEIARLKEQLAAVQAG